MSKYTRREPFVVAFPWHRNGDHPGDDAFRYIDGERTEFEGQIVGYLTENRKSRAKCKQCGKLLRDHGRLRIDNDQRVCPGDYVVHNEYGDYWVMSPGNFNIEFAEVKKVHKGDRERPKFHILKCWPGDFDEVVYGSKRHEVRVDDGRDYQEDDVLILQRFFDPQSRFERGQAGLYTLPAYDGQYAMFRIGPITRSNPDKKLEMGDVVCMTLNPLLTTVVSKATANRFGPDWMIRLPGDVKADKVRIHGPMFPKIDVGDLLAGERHGRV